MPLLSERGGQPTQDEGSRWACPWRWAAGWWTWLSPGPRPKGFKTSHHRSLPNFHPPAATWPARLLLSLCALLVRCFHQPLGARGCHRLPSSTGAPGAKTVASPRVPYVFIEGPFHYFSHTQAMFLKDTAAKKLHLLHND